MNCRRLRVVTTNNNTNGLEATMNKDELKADTLGQLIESGTVFTSADGRTVIIGETDTVAFQDSYGWQVAEDVVWNNVEDADFNEDILKKHARRWIHECGSRVRPGMAAEVKDNFGITYAEAVRVVEHIENAVITID
jgi:hypothetical protein